MSTHPEALATLSGHHIANLHALAARLESLPADPAEAHFRMSAYGYWKWVEGRDDNDRRQIGIPSEVLVAFDGGPEDCGTCACAVGHATLIPGLAPLESESWPTYEERVLGISSRSPGSFAFREEGDPILVAWQDLFGDCNTDDPHAAARRIREFLA